MQNTKLAWRLCRATQHFDDGTSKCKICGVLAENDAFDGGHQHKNSLHPSRRMAWEILRHGVAVFFLSPRKKTRHSSPNPTIPIKFYKISKNISIFILLLQNKALSLQRCSGQHKRIRHKYISFIREPAKLKNMFFCSSVEKTLTN